MLKIGLSACFFYPDPERVVFGHKSLSYVENDMASFVAQEGVMPVLIPDLPMTRLEPLLSELDGLILQGGADLCPESYGEPFLNKERWPGDKYRDAYELRLVDYFFKKHRPILGICRGFQLLNVYFGGTLCQDIATELNTTLEHRNALTYDRIHHSVLLSDSGWLSGLYGKERVEVNSVHHQAIKKLGKDLCVDALSESDGIIEAFTHSAHEEHFVAGVQWHPEFSATLAGVVASPDPIIRSFLNAAKK
ncbi:MAG: hypothetical protein RJB13_1614 [Pseudomonadota bacterium]